MLGFEQIISNPSLLAALAAAGMGLAALWSNPSRTINRIFFAGSLHVALWLTCHELAVRSGFYGQFWLRAASAVGAYIPLYLWFVKEAIVHESEPLAALVRRSVRWVVICTVLAALTQTEWFVATESSREAPNFRWGYYVYIGSLLSSYGWLCYSSLRQMRILRGVSRMEMQIVLLGGSGAAGAVMLLMALRAILHIPILVRVHPLVVLAFYIAMVIAITTHRIFDARQILLVLLQKLILVALVVGAAVVVNELLVQMQVPGLFALFVTTAVALWFAALLTKWLDRLFHFYPEAVMARQAAFSVAQRESPADKLEKEFLTVLKGWGQSDHALILYGTKEELQGGGFKLPGDGTVVRAMRQLRWATPERLTRERSTPERAVLQEFLKERALGVLVIGEGPSLTAFVGVGVAASRQPTTYPQVAQLMELAAIIVSALERAHFSVKAQRAEQLATVGLLGASLAHEIRNPLVTIKTFVQLLPRHHGDPVFREKFFRLIGEEVSRIDRLTEQLLDLAAPRAYSAQLLELHPVLRTSLELVAAKADDKRISILTDFQARPDQVYTDASAAKQVLLNLCFNALQAVEAHEGERWIKVATRTHNRTVEVVVEDSGPGIAPEMLPRLFLPFHSTKSTGFGLGLAICSDILTGLKATITVDPPVAGRGATFRINFPCQAS
ncbi:MAG: hypothetical protein KA257_04895 [Opitutaceae bacterium]|nr:hypothetical protein [Opitutaceae bacterium]MBP9914016.1 hypothetical protein [Opitutaceae bacterium]